MASLPLSACADARCARVRLRVSRRSAAAARRGSVFAGRLAAQAAAAARSDPRNARARRALVAAETAGDARRRLVFFRRRRVAARRNARRRIRSGRAGRRDRRARSGVQALARLGPCAPGAQRAGILQRPDQREDARRSRSHWPGQHDRLRDPAAARVPKPGVAAARRAADRKRRARRHRRARLAVRLGARHHARIRLHAARRRAGISDPAPQPSPRRRRCRCERACTVAAACDRDRFGRDRVPGVLRVGRERPAPARSVHDRGSSRRGLLDALSTAVRAADALSRCGRHPGRGRRARRDRSRAAPDVAAMAARDRRARRALARARPDLGKRSRRADAGAGGSVDSRREASWRARRTGRALPARVEGARSRSAARALANRSNRASPRS